MTIEGVDLDKETEKHFKNEVAMVKDIGDIGNSDKNRLPQRRDEEEKNQADQQNQK